MALCCQVTPMTWKQCHIMGVIPLGSTRWIRGGLTSMMAGCIWVRWNTLPRAPCQDTSYTLETLYSRVLLHTMGVSHSMVCTTTSSTCTHEVVLHTVMGYTITVSERPYG